MDQPSPHDVPSQADVQSLQEFEPHTNAFLAKLAHDLRNPLAPIASALQIIAMEPQNVAQVLQMREMIERQVLKLTGLIDSLADFSNRKAGESNSQRELISLNNTTSTPPLSRRRILVVDDNEPSAFLLSRLLQKLGQDVESAHSAKAALEILPRWNPQMVIADISMPGMTGYEMAEQIRKQTNIEQPYLIALTGHSNESAQQQAHAAGFNQHLIKPVDIRVLEKLLAEVS